METISTRLYFDTQETLMSPSLGMSVSAHFLRVEQLVNLHGIETVLDSFDLVLKSVFLTKDRQMCVLVALQYIAVIYGSVREHHYEQQLCTLRSTKRLEQTTESFSMRVMKYVYAGEAGLAVDSLISSFKWLRQQRVHDPSRLNIAAAYVCKEFGQFDLALQFSYLGYTSAFHDGEEYSINLASYFVLNTNRLTSPNSTALQSLFQKEVKKLESGQLDLGAHLNYLLPVYAASQELELDTPDLSRAEYLLSLANETDLVADGNSRSSWATAKGFLELHRGRISSAVRQLHHSELFQTRADATVEPLRQKLRLGLGLRTSTPALSWTPVSARAWTELASFAALQTAYAKSC